MTKINQTFYVFGAENGNSLKKYGVDKVKEAINDFLNAETKEYVSLGVEFTGKQFTYGVSSCDLFSKKDGVKKISQDYKSFYTGEVLNYTQQLIEVLNKVVKA